jgi:hypothetical protein
MQAVAMRYDYSTKNFHRFVTTVPGGAVNEVYVPRSAMPQPVTEISVTVAVTNAQQTLEKVKAK